MMRIFENYCHPLHRLSVGRHPERGDTDPAREEQVPTAVGAADLQRVLSRWQPRQQIPAHDGRQQQ